MSECQIMNACSHVSCLKRALRKYLLCETTKNCGSWIRGIVGKLQVQHPIIDGVPTVGVELLELQFWNAKLFFAEFEAELSALGRIPCEPAPYTQCRIPLLFTAVTIYCRHTHTYNAFTTIGYGCDLIHCLYSIQLHWPLSTVTFHTNGTRDSKENVWISLRKHIWIQSWIHLTHSSSN